MIGRRAFLGLLGGAAAAAADSGGILSGAPGAVQGSASLRRMLRVDRAARPGSRQPVLDPVGVQLYTLRREMREDFDATLETVASVGYREVEFAGYYDRTPAQVRAVLEANGLTSPATHIGLEQISAAPERTFADSAEMGHQYVIAPSLPRGQRASVDGIREVAVSLNRLGQVAASSGIKVGFHNHSAEFEAVDGVLPFDVLLDETDPELVVFEMDMYWIRVGGADWRSYFERWPGRFHMIHAKDMGAGAEGGMTDVGSGVIDFAAILGAAEQGGIRHTFVEHDSPQDAVASVRASYAYLSALQG